MRFLKRYDPFNNSNIKKVHFIGIGGISMSGLAEILQDWGYTVTGSDTRASGITQRLESKGITVFRHNSPENISDPDLIVYTLAVRKDNPEYRRAVETGVPMMVRAELLGLISDRYPSSIGVAGTHGKTTATSMVAMIMLEAGKDPTIHIGGELEAIGGTVHIGSGRYFVTEADEYKASLLKLHNDISVILNIEFDHSDFYRDINHVKDVFREYALNTPENGIIIACGDDPEVAGILDIPRKKVLFGIDNPDCEWRAGNIRYDMNGLASFNVVHNGKPLERIRLNVPGKHNVYNALASIAACSFAGCGIAPAKKALAAFRGTRRRFEEKGYYKGTRIVDDYAHHPSEIRATLAAAEKTAHKCLWCIFQPHTYSRTLSLFENFVSSFDKADKIIIADIYAAREIDDGSINSAMLAEKIAARGKNAIHMDSFGAIADYIAQNAAPGDLVLTMGAGDINLVGEMLIEKGNKVGTGTVSCAG